MITKTFNEWEAEGEKLFGKDKKQWKFKCVQCGHVQTIQDFIDAGVKEPQDYVFFSCLGRFVEGRGCNWTLGGLLRIHELEVISDDNRTVPCFEFAN